MLTWLKVDEFVNNPGGADTPDTDPTLTEAELNRTIQSATKLILAHTHGDLLCQTYPDEIHRYVIDASTGALTMRLHHKPARLVTNVSFLLGFWAGGRYGPGFGVTPPENVNPPVIMGNLVLDRNSNLARVYRPVLSYNPGFQIAASQARLGVTYTGGYDDGTMQADGVGLPAPFWLKEVSRLATIHLLEQRKRRRKGRGWKGSYSVGTVSESYGESVHDDTLPQSLIDIIDRNYQNYSMGGTGNTWVS